MRIEIDIPDSAGDQCIRVLSGVETMAFKPVDKPWMIKKTRCARCGFCCQGCEYLDFQDGIAVCGRGLSRPFNCIVEISGFKNCKTEYEECK